jgi:HAD superfamily hydrolase (TIGR01484 family)
MIENQLEIKNYVKNKEKRVVNGRCLQAKMIVTSQDDSENLLLEIIPKYSGKGTAVKYAQMLFGFIDEETFTAGDSLNDRDAFKVESVRGVIVQNAQETLIKWFKNKKRENIFLSNENFGLALIDILSKFALEETSSTIFIYRENENLKVTVDEKVCVLKSFKEKWAYFSTQSRNFTVNDGITFEIPENGRFALYRSKLLRIQMNLFDVLFVSDLDGTIFMNTPEGLQFYYDFIEFWITFYEFNSSVLVYNTGRNIPNYLEEAENLFQPDLLLTSLSSFAFQLDKKLTMSEDKNFFQFLNNVPRHDWNSEALVKILQEKFKFKQDNFERIYETYILARVKSKMIRSQLANIKNFLKNKENLQHAGYVFKGKVRVLKLGMVGKRLVEIIPLFVGKGFGVRYAQMKFSFELRFTVVAGDSPNDIDAFKTDANCIAMINSEEMLKDWVNKKKRDNLVVSQQKWAKGLEIEFRKRLIN